MIYEKALSERLRLEKEIANLQWQISNLPNGKLICSHSGKYKKYYASDGHNKTYISAKEHSFAEQLAIKKYLTALLDDYTHELMALNLYLKHHQNHTHHAEDLLLDTSMYHNLLSPVFKPLSKELTEWMNSEYERKTDYPEQLIHTGLSGNQLRSKSEAMIDMFLCNNRIPFRYECKLELGDITYFPDFTIRHPKTGNYYYWEHFGMMDNPTYAKNAFSKLQNYTIHGFIPSVNLITTYETSTQPLTTDLIKATIEYYFL